MCIAKKEEDNDDDNILDLMGDNALDVVTGGIYGAVTHSLEAVDEAEKEQRQHETKKTDDLMEDAALAGTIAANALTLGLAGDIYEVVDATVGNADEEEDREAKLKNQETTSHPDE